MNANEGILYKFYYSSLRLCRVLKEKSTQEEDSQKE